VLGTAGPDASPCTSAGPSTSQRLDGLWSSTYLPVLLSLLDDLDAEQAVTAAVGVSRAA
jgi:hypothetical protein